jgi:hypothetical protein
LRRRFAITLPLLLAACGGGSQQAAPPIAPDEVLERMARAALSALELNQPESAARLYARALTRARERDDPAAIADMGFGQATAALAHGDARGALQVAQDVRQEMERRGRPATPSLLLVEATALHRLGRAAEADGVAAQVQPMAAEAPEAARRAMFLRGLIAAERGDARALNGFRQALGEADAPAYRADVLELDARAALLRRDHATARRLAAQSADLRQQAVDYRGLSRALAVQGRAAARMGDRAAGADLLLRAGRGAAERGETADARRWLAEAERLARDARARRTLAELREVSATLPRR